MRLWIDGKPGLEEPPEELAEKAWRALVAGPSAKGLALPLYSHAGLSVRIRFVYELKGDIHLHTLPATPAISTLAWFWVHVLEGLLWTDGGQVAELHVRREWGRVAGVEVTV